jgi:FkbM family methyltransferase
MSTKYFILTKTTNENVSVADNDTNQVVHLNNHLCYILPQNLMMDYTARGLFEAPLIEWCKQFCSPEKNMLDIGAHTGTYALSLSNVCNEVYCFEPQEMTYYALCGGVALSNKRNIRCFNMGLGSEEQRGKKTLNIVSNDGGGSTIHHTQGMNILREEEIAIDTLDSFQLTNIGFIKMDVEENEYFVLLGARNTLEESGFPAILFECNNPGDNKQLFEYLVTLGYKVVHVSGVNNMFLASV